MNISDEVELGGALIRANIVEKEQEFSILHKDKRVQAFFDLKKSSTKRDIQVLCGMLASLQAWNPNIPLNIPMLRKASGLTDKVTFKYF